MHEGRCAQGPRDRALDVVRGYADHDAAAVHEALDGLDAGGSLEVYAILILDVLAEFRQVAAALADEWVYDIPEHS